MKVLDFVLCFSLFNVKAPNVERPSFGLIPGIDFESVSTSAATLSVSSVAAATVPANSQLSIVLPANLSKYNDFFLVFGSKFLPQDLNHLSRMAEGGDFRFFASSIILLAKKLTPQEAHDAAAFSEFFLSASLLDFFKTSSFEGEWTFEKLFDAYTIFKNSLKNLFFNTQDVAFKRDLACESVLGVFQKFIVDELKKHGFMVELYFSLKSETPEIVVNRLLIEKKYTISIKTCDLMSDFSSLLVNFGKYCKFINDAGIVSTFLTTLLQDGKLDNYLFSKGIFVKFTHGASHVFCEEDVLNRLQQALKEAPCTHEFMEQGVQLTKTLNEIFIEMTALPGAFFVLYDFFFGDRNLISTGVAVSGYDFINRMLTSQMYEGNPNLSQLRKCKSHQEILANLIELFQSTRFEDFTIADSEVSSDNFENFLYRLEWEHGLRVGFNVASSRPELVNICGEPTLRILRSVETLDFFEENATVVYPLGFTAKTASNMLRQIVKLIQTYQLSVGCKAINSVEEIPTDDFSALNAYMEKVKRNYKRMYGNFIKEITRNAARDEARFEAEGDSESELFEVVEE